MTAIFVSTAVLLTLIAALALAWPLRRQSRPAYAGVTLSIVLLTACLYLLVGTPAALDPAARQAPRTLEEAVTRLQADLARDPRQGDGWHLLGSAYRELGRYTEARDAFGQAAQLDPDDIAAQLAYAEARSLADPQRRFDAQATRVLEQILARDPTQERARLFLGIAQRQAGRDADAALTWEPLLATLDGEAAQGLRSQIDAARQAAGLPPLPPDHPDTAAASSHAIAVHVALDPSLQARAAMQPQAVIFVIARVPGGGPMPVAVQRRTATELPFQLTLDDRHSPMPTQTLSDLTEVEVLARWSDDGSASAQPDDLTAIPVRVALPAEGPVHLVLGAID